MDDWNGKGPLDEDNVDDERARRAIEASTLGTEAARAVRAQVRPEVGDALLERVRARLAEEGLPGGVTAVEPADGDVAAHDAPAAPAAAGQADASSVVASDEGRLPGWRHDDEHVDQLVKRYWPGVDDVETLTCDADPRRVRVLALLAARIEEVTGHAASDINEESRFREDLGVDSLDAVEISTAMEDEFRMRVSAGQLASLHMVSDAIDLLLGHVAATSAPDFDATMSPTTSTTSSPRRKKQAL